MVYLAGKGDEAQKTSAALEWSAEVNGLPVYTADRRVLFFRLKKATGWGDSKSRKEPSNRPTYIPNIQSARKGLGQAPDVDKENPTHKNVSCPQTPPNS